jgi:hypothetical protein
VNECLYRNIRSVIFLSGRYWIGEVRSEPLGIEEGVEAMRGDHLLIDRGPYWHHAIDRGDGSVVHFAGPVKQKAFAYVRIDPYEAFVGDGSSTSVVTREYGQRLDREETVRRAEAMVGGSGYNLFTNNCEHLATWCVTGEPESRQVEQFTAVGSVSVITVGAGVLTKDLLDGVGKVSGLSGPGVLSALSTTGQLVGGGAVAGLYLLGLVPAGLGVSIVFYVARDKPHLTDSERHARAVARGVGLVTALLTGFVAIGVLSAVGKTKGLSGAGISSGLASIGNVAGSGGMVSGACVLIGAPVIASSSLSALAYEFMMRRQTRVSSPVLNAGA